MTTTPHRVGYAGLDHHHAEPYLQTLETLSAEVVAATEPNDNFDFRSVASLGLSGDGDVAVPVYDDLAEMLDAESLDTVFLTLPNSDTPGAIRTALDAGVDVYTEKPAARTAAELEPLVARTAESDSVVCVSYPWQFHPITREIAGLVDEGFYGVLQAFEARFVASQLAFRNVDHFVYDQDASGGGILQWLGIHWIHLFTWLLDDEIVRVNASTTHNTDAVDVEDGATLQLETADGALGTLTCGYHLPEGVYDTRFDLYGSNGRSSWDPMGREFGFDGETTLELDDASGEWASTPHRTVTHDYESEQGYGGAFGREFVAGFFAACKDGGEPPVTLESALAVLRLVDAAYKSAETDQWVSVDDDAVELHDWTDDAI